jgi:hypothetical protein
MRASVPFGFGASPERRRTDTAPLLRARQRGHGSLRVASWRPSETVRPQAGQFIRVIAVSFGVIGLTRIRST